MIYQKGREMKYVIRVVLLMVMVFGFAEAKMFQTVAPEKAQLLQTGKGKLYCPNCGMNLVMFYKTSHAMKQKDGSMHQYCSMHCLVETNDQVNADAKVVDVSSLKFIKAYDAHYVVGSKKKGTMTMNSKYAFATKADAEAFAKANGGKVMGFEAAAKIAAKALSKENMMINKKRGMMAEKGEMMYKKMCKQTNLPKFSSIADAKIHIVESGICGKLEDKKNQAIAIYLFRKDQ